MRKATTKRATKKSTKQEKVAESSQPKFSLTMDGLRSGVQYSFKEDGRVDWRKMIPDEWISLNREKFLKKNDPIDIDALTKEEIADLKKNARDEDLIIKLGGYRDLAEIRGFSCVEEEIVHASPDFVCVKCTISWLPNFETFGKEVKFSASADAHIGNCSKEFGANYLTAIASNRAFSRAVRNFLRIGIVAQDEISFEKPEEIVTSVGVTPSSVLEDKLQKLNISFEDFKTRLAEEDYEFAGLEAWKSTKDIQAKYLPVIFGCLVRWK